MRYRIDMSYDGSAFFGWQTQPDSPSVQSTLEHALRILLKEEVKVVGAGRTDTGVHASAYTAHFDTSSPVEDCRQLAYKLNAILPNGVAVSEVCGASDGFHARFDARRREYRYFIHRKKNPFLDSYSYFYGYPDLDFDAMNKAAESLLGTHDFSCFEKSGTDNKTSICTILHARWTPVGSPGPMDNGEDAGGTDRWCFTICADRFLRNMVRAIVGTLLEVGRGKRSADSITALLESKDRCASGESVPGKALFLSKIEY